MPCLHEAIVQATRLRIVAAMQIKSIKNKLDFRGLDGHNNVPFIAYGNQWLDWHKKGKLPNRTSFKTVQLSNCNSQYQVYFH